MNRTRRSFATAIAVLVVLTLVVPVPAMADTGYAKYATMTVIGHGRAHGVGLCMSSVKNRALAGWTYGRILSYFYRNTRVQYKTNIPQTVRVGVYRRRGSVSVTAGIGSYYSVRTSSGRILFKGGAGKVTSVWRADGRYVVVMRRGNTVWGPKKTTAPVRIHPGSGTILKVVNDGHMYRGKIEIRRGASTGYMWAVNIVAIESYLRGLGEEPDSWPMTGLKVLAIVSRSYAAYRSANWKHAGDGFAICNTGDCQAYVGYNYERTAPRLRSAVSATAHRVVTYAGSLVVTPYFSNSGGYTENIEYVWGGSPKPWLKGVNTYRWAAWHSAFNWHTHLSMNAMRIRLAQSSSTKVPGTLVGFKILSVGRSPRVRSMSIVGSAGSKTVSGGTFQNVVGLQSTWFRFNLPPRLQYVTYTPTVSPNGDGVEDTATVGYTLSEAARMSFEIRKTTGDLGRVYNSGAFNQTAGRRYLRWNGKGADGKVVPDGRYRMIVWAVDSLGNKNNTSVYITKT